MPDREQIACKAPTFWPDHISAAVTICDADGKILYLNEQSARTFQKDGGMDLIGESLFDCHPEPARSHLRKLIEDQQSNTYSIEKGGQKKLIYQSPWFADGVFAGFVEISILIPEKMPHHKRD